MTACSTITGIMAPIIGTLAAIMVVVPVLLLMMIVITIIGCIVTIKIS